nr:hypothetical protein [uncultured Actinotalea sp.]
MYSPETLLQIHHLRHDELVAATVRPDPADPRVRCPASRSAVVGRTVRSAGAGAQRVVGDAVARVGAAVGVAAGARRDASPVCCPA